MKLNGCNAADLQLHTRNEILAAMVVFGFLSYHEGILSIPNHELMEKYQLLLERESMGEVQKYDKKSKMYECKIEKSKKYVSERGRL